MVSRKLARAVRLARAVGAVARERHVTSAAAAVAYYAFSSLVPLLLLVFVAVTVLGGIGSLAAALQVATGVGAAEYEALFERVGAAGDGRTRTVLLATGIFAWSTLRLFRGVAGVFTELYGTRKDDSVRRRLRDAVLATLTVVVGVPVVVAGGVALAVRVPGPLWWVLGPVVLAAVLATVFVPMYYLSPNADVTVREALPGAVLAAVAWAVSGAVVRAYLSLSESVQLYGVAGAVLIVLTWLYVGSLATLVGVVLNAVRAGRVEVDYSWLPGEDDEDGAAADDVGGEDDEDGDGTGEPRSVGPDSH